MSNWIISTDVEFDSDIFNEKLSVSPWSGHRNFAYDFITNVKPQTIVELGTHYGCSFFSFCQAVKDKQLDSRLFAIDTWEGDIHAGFYNDDVYQQVVKTIRKQFIDQHIYLYKNTFDQCLKKFNNHTIDLLHIDGLHTYDATRQDFESWLPKLSKNGVIFFHDVAEYTGYGSFDFWTEIKQRYPSFEFPHSWGLGVLFPKGEKVLNDFFYSDTMNAMLLRYYHYQAEKALFAIQLSDHKQMIVQRDQTLSEQSQIIQEQQQANSAQTQLINERDNTIANQDLLIKHRNKTINAQTILIDERDQTIADQTRLLTQKDETIQQQAELITDKDQGLQSQKRLIDERDQTITHQQELIECKDKVVNSQQDTISEYTQALEKMMKYNFFIRLFIPFKTNPLSRAQKK